jgi:chemotaxis signal transduction protein
VESVLEILDIQEVQSRIEPLSTGGRAFEHCGHLVPVIDLRHGETETPELLPELFGEGSGWQAGVVILNFDGLFVGIIVDAVGDSVHISAEDILPLEDTHLGPHVLGLCHVNDRSVLLLNLPALLGLDEAPLIEPGQSETDAD